MEKGNTSSPDPSSFFKKSEVFCSSVVAFSKFPGECEEQNLIKKIL